MARTGIVYQQVVAVAKEFHKKGLNPTVDSIRHVLKTGSRTTINTFLRRWREEHMKPSTHYEKLLHKVESLQKKVVEMEGAIKLLSGRRH